MPTREAQARWEGSIQKGKGTLQSGSGAIDAGYSFASRFKADSGTNPEELLGAAEAGCLAMAVAKALGDKGHDPRSVEVDAEVRLVDDGGTPTIGRIDLTVRASVPGFKESDLVQVAERAKESCPVSRALIGTEVALKDVKLVD